MDDPGVALYALVTTIDGASFGPPLGPTIEPSGAFDPSLLARLEVLLEAEDGAGRVTTLGAFSGSTEPGLKLLAPHELYWMNVPAAAYFTDPSSSYTFRVLLDGREVGRSDMSSKIFEVMRYVPTVPVGVKLRLEARGAPVLSSLAPASQLAGGADFTLTVRGAAFARDSVVRFAGRNLSTTWISAAELRAAAPAAAIARVGRSEVTVFTPAPGGGTSGAAQFTASNPTPILSALSPARATTGGGDLELTAIGASFVDGARVTFAGRYLAATFVSTGELRAVVPAASLAPAGEASVVVVNPDPGGPSQALAFEIDDPAPSLASLSPSSVVAGSGSFVLTVTGASFVAGASVSVAGAPVATSFVSATELRATMPAALVVTPAMLDVAVSNPAPASGSAAHATLTVYPAAGLTISSAVNLTTTAITAGRTCAEAYALSVVALTDTTATLASAPAAGCFAAGDIVLLINLQGSASSTLNVGRFEELTIAAVSGATVTFRSPKTNLYGSGADDADLGTASGLQKVVLQRVPVLGDVTIDASGSLTVSAWDGAKGGVLALRAGHLTVNGALTVSARGYRGGAYSRDDNTCSDSVATGRGESIGGPSVVTTAASYGASGGMTAGSLAFATNTPLGPSAGHATAGQAGANPRGRTLGATGGTYGVNDGSRLTLGSGAGGNLTCAAGTFAPYLVAVAAHAGGILAVWADTIVVNPGGSISAVGADGSRNASSGGYVMLRANRLTLGTNLVTARGAAGVSGSYSNQGGAGYVVLYHRDPLSGTTSPAAYDSTTPTPFDP